MAEASREYVVLDELQDKIGERLARLIGSEDAMVTTGAAGGYLTGDLCQPDRFRHRKRSAVAGSYGHEE